MRSINRRVTMVGAVLLVAIALMGFVGQRAFAQDQTTNSVYNAQVGTWFIGLQGDALGQGGTLATFNPDGSVIVHAAPGPRPYLWMGQWKPTGPLTSDLTIVGANTDQTGVFSGNSTLYGNITIDTSGDTFAINGTIVSRDIAGVELGRFPVLAIGSRIEISSLPPAPPATPVASPEASPTS